MPEKEAVYTIGWFHDAMAANADLKLAMTELAAWVKQSEGQHQNTTTGGKMKYTLMNEKKDVMFDGLVKNPGSIIPLVNIMDAGGERLVFAHWGEDRHLIAFPDEGTWINASNRDYKYRHLRDGESVSYKGGKWTLSGNGPSHIIKAGDLFCGEYAVLMKQCIASGQIFQPGSILVRMPAAVFISAGVGEVTTDNFTAIEVRRLRPGEWVKVEPA
jgi:hypothetical protein